MDKFAERMAGPILRRVQNRLHQDRTWPARVSMSASQYATMPDTAISSRVQTLREAFVRQGFSDPLVAESFALVREVAGLTVGMRHFDVQLLGGYALLRGHVAEMQTGEGKTLTSTLPACTAAFAGIPVHIVTVNDYLARRDAETMGPVFGALGLSVGVIVHGLTLEERRAAYACDVTYCTNKELVFDYLKDRLTLGRMPNSLYVQLERLSGESSRPHQLLLRGLHYAIVDEADSVLVDEARTPLVIAGRGNTDYERHVYEQALSVARRLKQGSDFRLHVRERHIRLTEEGLARVSELTRSLDGVWQGRGRREDLVRHALTALHLFIRDKHYVVQDAKVQIVDEYTGRLMPDRSWERGLHQMIDAKEECPLSDRQETLARISYQRFFRRYLRLAGMTGTAREIAGELWSVYRLSVVSIPTNRPLRRRRRPLRLHRTSTDRWNDLVRSVQVLHQEGRPVLIGTRSVAASEHCSRLLSEAGLPHRVLNARQDKEEADIIARAGENGQITVATNMAGRGTDIHLDPTVAARGGLHVIATERHDAGRIDRQLFGRCGRQGDPGSYQALLSLEDELVTAHVSRLWWLLASVALSLGMRWPALIMFWWAQRSAERIHTRMRTAVMRIDDQLDSTLAFAGRLE
ncbi:MAG: preprotein translocase subunit SecA [Nitrospira sp.]|nr:preprotein translocase subunit SecA [Nitrospira sp.]